MDPEKVKAALEALKNDDAAAALSILEELIVSAAGGGAAPAEASAEPLAETPDPEPKKEDEAYAKELMRLTATASPSEALAEAKRRLERDAANEDQRKALELSARVDLIAELVKLGIEFPATAWAGDATKRVPVKRLADEPIDDLRARVALHRKNAPADPPAPPRRKAAEGEIETPFGVVTLSARERAMCAEMNVDVQKYAAQKASAKKA